MKARKQHRSIICLIITFGIMLLQDRDIFAASIDDDIPYEDNDNSYVTIKSNKYQELELDTDFNILEKVNIKELAIHACSELPLHFDICLPSACYGTSPFGKTYRKIIGKTQDGSCEYIERTPEFGGINCTFNGGKDIGFSGILDKYFSKMENPTAVVSSADISQIRNLMEANCTIVKDRELTRLVIMGDQTGKEIEDRKFAGLSHAIAKSNAQGNPTALLPQTSVAGQRDQPMTRGISQLRQSPRRSRIASVMFTKPELDKISSFLAGGDIKHAQETEQVAKGNIAFYLDSILFLNEDNWAIWLNGRKFTKSDAGEGLTVQSVNKSQVECTWLAKNLDKIAPDWRKKLTFISTNLFASPDNNIQVKIQNQDTGFIKFVIKPNQTMSISAMNISEGNNN